MGLKKIPHEHVHKNLDVDYFSDYALFSGAVRQYVAKTLEQTFRDDPNDHHSRLCILGLYKEEFAAYEDLGAFLEAFIRWNLNEIQVPFEGILRYTDGKVVLESLFKRRKILKYQDLFKTLKFDNIIPTDWNQTFPDINCRAGIIGICKFIVEDCASNQQQYGIEAYNKIKHGLAIFPNGNKFSTQLPNCPAVIINNREKSNPNPYTLLALPMTNEAILQRATIVEFVQASLRTLAVLYVIKNYPEHFKKTYNLKSDVEVFLTDTMSDVKSFFWQIAKKYDGED